MEPSKYPYQKPHYFNPKLSLDITNKRQAQIHHYKYINTLEASRISDVIRNNKDRHLGSYTKILKKIKQMRYFNNENIIQIPKNVFSILKKYSHSLKKADAIEFRNIYTIRHFKMVEQAILIDILPSEVKGNRKLFHAMFSLPLFASRTNFDTYKAFFNTKTITPNYSSIKEITVEMESKISKFRLANAKEFEKLASEFNESSLHLISNIPLKQVKLLPGFLSGNKKAIQVLAPTSDFSLPFLDHLIQESKSLKNLENLVFFEDFEAQKPSTDERKESFNSIIDFKFLRQFENLRVLGLGFDCSPFAKNMAQIINSMTFPESLEFLGLQLVNFDLGVTLEEFLVDSGTHNYDSALVSCFKPFIENFSKLVKLRTFALEVGHPSTDAKLAFDLSSEIIRRIPYRLTTVFLGFDHCRTSLEKIEIEPLMIEISRLRPSRMYISLPLGSVTGFCKRDILRDVLSISSGYLLTNFSKETLAQVAEINGNSWFFGTTFGNANLSFPFEDFLKSDANMQIMLDKFIQKDVACTVMPHSLMYFFNISMLSNVGGAVEPDVRLAKISYRKDPQNGKTLVLLEGEIQIEKQTERLNMIASLD